MSRLDPYWPFMQLRRELSHLLDDFDVGGQPRYPALNVWEDQNSFYAEAEIPGVSQDQLEVFTIGDELTIRGERKPLEGNGVNYHRRERGLGTFERVVTLPAEVDANKVEAHLHNGVLSIVMPKAEQAKARKIQVNVG